MNEVKEKAWCTKHLTSRPGKDQFGNWYKQCYTGHTLNEECEIKVEKIEDKVSER